MESVTLSLQTLLVPVLAAVSLLLGIGVLAGRGRLKKLQGALRDRERQLRRSMDNTPEALMILDVTRDRFTVVNERTVQLFGWPAEKLLQMGVADVSPPYQPDGRASSTAAGAVIQKAVEGGEPVFPWVHLNAAGESVPCEVRLVRIPDDERVLVRGSVVDISERLRADNELRRSKERYRTVVDAQRELLLRWLPDGTRTFVNRAYCRFFGRPEEELLGTNFLSELEAEERARIQRNVAALSTDNPLIVSEVRVSGDHEEPCWLEWSDTGLFDDQGRLVEIQAIGRDVTERRNARDKLEYTRSLLTAALEQSPAGIAIAAAPDGRIHLANQAMMDILGVTRESLKETLDQLPLGGPPRAGGTAGIDQDSPLCRALFAGEVRRDFELRIQRPDGQERWASISCAPVEDAAGEIIAGIIVCADVTETRRSHLAIRGVVESVSSVSGREFYEALVAKLSQVLDTDVAFVGERIEGQDAIRTLAVYRDGELVTPSAAFDSTGTPSSEVIRRGRPLVCDDADQRFPEDPHMRGDFRSYVGIPLLARDGAPIGVLSICGRRPLEKARLKVDILELFGARASTELMSERTARVLAQSEERFRTAFEEAPIGIMMLDREGRLMHSNNTLSRMLGYSRREFAALRMRDLMHPDELERMFESKKRMLQGEIDRESGEFRMVRKDGAPEWVNFSGRVMPDPSGEQFVLAMVESISARREAEQNLEASRQLQRIVAEASAGFYGCRPEDVDRRVDQVLARVGEYLSIDRITFYEICGDLATATHSWYRDGGTPPVPQLRRSAFPNGWGVKIFRFTSFEDLPEEASLEREAFTALGIKSMIGIPLQVGGSPAGIFSLAAVRSERTWSEELAEWLQILGEMLASVLARRRVETDLREIMQMQCLVAEVSASFVGASAGQLDGQIREALRRVGESLEIDRISLYRLDQSVGELLHFWNREGTAMPFAQLSLLTQVPFLARAANAGELVSFSTVEELGEEMAAERELFSYLGTRSLLGIPLRLGDSLVGSLILSTVIDERQWPSSLVQWMRLFGEMLAGAIARAGAEESQNQSRRQLRALAHELTRTEERERRRFSTYLHDQIGQTLAVMRMRFGELLLPESEESKRACIEEMRDLLETTIDDAQTLTFDLSPPVLHDLGLVAAIEWIGEKICQENGIGFELEVVDAENAPRKNVDTASILFRSLRELLINVVSHGAATAVQIRVEFTVEGIRIDVADDGVGFDTSILESRKNMKHFGLFSIRERLDFIGGSFEVSSGSGLGTRVSLFAPLQAPLTAGQLVLQ